MRRYAVVLVALILAVGIYVGYAHRPSPPAQASTAKAVAEAALEGTGIRFTLRNYQGEQMPSLHLTSADGKDWTAKLDAPERDEKVVTVRLRGEKGTARLAVEQMSYRWTLPDGTSVPGGILFRAFLFRDMKWQTLQSDKFLIYHVKPLPESEWSVWQDLLDRATLWTGQKSGDRLVIWVFPDDESLNQWGGYTTLRVAGLWMDDIQRLMISSGNFGTDGKVVLLHEMVHALSPGKGPAYFEEGAARLFECREERLLLGNGAPRWFQTRQQLQALQRLARERELSPIEALSYDAQMTDPYTLGVSLWLFVKHHHGEAGVQRFFAEGGKENGVMNSLEEIFHKPYHDVIRDWNAYLRSSDLARDWDSP